MGTIYLANFNITFGKEEKPLLEYFDTILYPALKSELKRVYVDRAEQITTQYFFDDVKVIKMNNGEYALRGRFIKDTEIHIKNTYNNETKQLVNVGKRLPTAPYSIFIVFLKNHRVVLFKDQKESPDLRNMNTTLKYILKEFVTIKNQEIDNKEDQLPYAHVNVIGIHMTETIQEKLKDVKKIQTMKIRMYPLNGDCDFMDSFRAIGDEIDSKNISALFNSPSNKKKVSELISKAKGLASILLKVVYKNGSEGKIGDEDFTEKVEKNFVGQEFEDKANELEQYALDVPEMQQCSEENLSIYQRHIEVIEKNM